MIKTCAARKSTNRNFRTNFGFRLDNWTCIPKWMKHFKGHANPSEDNKVLLIPDGHSSPEKSCYVNSVCYTSLHPSSWATRLVFHGLLKTRYVQEVIEKLKWHSVRDVTDNRACWITCWSCRKPNALSGFAKRGMCPCNRHILRVCYSVQLFADKKQTDKSQIHPVFTPQNLFSQLVLKPTRILQQNLFLRLLKPIRIRQQSLFLQLLKSLNLQWSKLMRPRLLVVLYLKQRN